MNVKKIKGSRLLGTDVRRDQRERNRIGAATEGDGHRLIWGKMCQRLLECPHGAFWPGAVHANTQGRAPLGAHLLKTTVGQQALESVIDELLRRHA